MVVTTAAQFFDSLFSNRPSRCRKLHNLAQSVIVLDEAQMLPVGLLRPCMASIDELARNYGASVVLCTATQPALRRVDQALLMERGGQRVVAPCALDIPPERELAPQPERLFTALKRVEVEHREGPTPDAAILDALADAPQMLVIVNARAHARALFDAMRAAGLEGVAHLTTLMCAAHRQAALRRIRARLAAGAQVRLVSTSLIEAGVDISFPAVWRAAAGVDRIAQAAGRCNREGDGPLGRVVVFEAEAVEGESRNPRSMRPERDAADAVFRAGLDPLGLDGVHRYFRELYSTRGGPERLDEARLDGKPYAVMAAIAASAPGLTFPFETIARAFRMVDADMPPVFVRWDDAARAAIEAVRHAERPPAAALRTLQRYQVPVPHRALGALLAAGAAEQIGPEDAFAALTTHARYSEDYGLDLSDPAFRSAEDNVIS